MIDQDKKTLGSLLFVAPSAYPLGGVAVWLRYLLDGLVEKGFNVNLGLLSGAFHKPEVYLERNPHENSNVNVISIDSGSGTREGRVVAIEQAIVKVAADIVISVNAPDVFEAGNRVKTQTNNQLKTVMTLHGLEPDYFLDIKVNHAQIDAVVATNQLTCLMIEKWADFPAQQILYAPYGVEINNKKPQKKPKKTSTPLTILYAGRIEQEQKRINDLVNVVDELERNGFAYELLLAGDGKQTESLMNELGRKIKVGELNYLGNLSQSALFEQGYKKADALILLSDWETGPIVIWEAMSHGLAIVSSQYHGSLAEGALVNDENALLFPIGDSVTAAKAIMRLSDMVLRQRLISNAHKLVQNRYSRKKSIDQWSQAFTNIMESFSSKPAMAWRKAWKKQGKLEQILGHAGGNKARLLINKPALQNSAGAEWPHSLSKVSLAEEQRFFQAIERVES